MRIRSMVGGLMVASLSLAGPALAVEATQVGESLGFNEQLTQVGVHARVGLGTFTGDLADVTGTAPLLGVTAEARPWRYVGVEVGYEGERFPIDDERVGDEQSVWRHNVALLAKAGPTFLEDKLQPYAGAGLGFSYLNVTDGADDTGLYGNGDITTEVPLALGVDYRFTPNIFAGARGSYSLMFGEEFADDALEGDPGGDIFNASLLVGGRF